MRKQKYLTVLFVLFLQYTLLAHNVIKGKVIDANTNTPLVGTSIILSGTSEGCTTDDWGNFLIDTDYESGVLIISYLGYESQEIEFTSHTEFLVIELKPDIVDLGTINISASKITPMESMAQIDVKLRPVKTSQDVLRIVPGLFIAQHAGGGKSEQIFLRGFDADHGTDVNISVDGIPVNMVSQAHGQGYADLHFVIPELVREVDFGKGPYYAGYGDFSTAGYVSFKTMNTLKENLIKVEGGSFNTTRVVGLFKLLSKKQETNGKSAYVAVENFNTDGPFNSPQNFNRLNMVARHNNIIDRYNMFTLTASIFNSKWDQSGQIPQKSIDNGIINRWGSIDPTEGGNSQRYNFIAKSVHQLPQGAMFCNQLYYTHYKFDLFSNFTFFLNNQGFGDQIEQKEYRDLYGYTAKYSKSHSLKKNSTIDYEIGGGFRLDKITNSQLLNTYKRYTVLDTFNIGDINELNLNMYAKLNWTINKWFINMGLRFDNFKFEYSDKKTGEYNNASKYKSTLSPKLNIVFNASENFQLYAKFGKSFHSNDARVVVNSDSLSTLPYALGSDLGFNWKPFPRFIVNAAIWYMFLEEELVWSGDAGSWEPSGRTRRIGLDLSLRWQMGRSLFFDTDINLCDARYIDLPYGKNYIPLSPKISSTGGLNYKYRKSWTASLRYRYLASRPADEINLVSTKSYFIMDFQTYYTTKSRFSIGLTIENILNTDWNEAQFATDYRLYKGDEDYGLTFTPGVPLSFKLGLSYSF
ncbi:MAG: TonB-dependent receptor [Marinilabiliales bacterium]|nr:MAG: TonB-dependent receptor [Marinilabiliales bacterium]